MNLDERVNTMLGNGVVCKFFYINKDDKWCLKFGYHKDIPLDNYTEEELDNLFNGLLEEEISYRTKMNIEQIKSELWK